MLSKSNANAMVLLNNANAEQSIRLSPQKSLKAKGKWLKSVPRNHNNQPKSRTHG